MVVEEEERPGIGEALKRAVQGVMNDYADMFGGASLVGDLVVLMETHDTDVYLRHVDSGVPSWRQIGMLMSAVNTLNTEETLAAMMGPSGGDDA